MRLPFKRIECAKCGNKMMQNQLIPIRPFNDNKYKCPKCKTEIEIITEDK